MFAFVFFFFQQKTAYEMRISDGSSDVCSSDLYGASVNFRFRQLLIWFFLLLRLPLAQLGKLGLGLILLPGQTINSPLQSSGLTLCWRQFRLLRLLSSEERRVGKEWVSSGRSRWSPSP